METETSIATIKLMNQDLVKLDRFDGTNLTRWQDKLKFLLTALKIFYVFNPELAPIPEPTEEDTDERRAERKKQQEDELICRGHILNAYRIVFMISTLPLNRRGRFEMHSSLNIRLMRKVLKIL